MVESDLQQGFSALRRFAQQPRPAVQADEARCELCSAGIPPEHRHMMEIVTRQILCVCQPCSILFHQAAASEGKYRLIPRDRYHLANFHIDDVEWASLRIPVEMAFFFHSTVAGRVVAFYPSPMGPTESLLPLATWQILIERNPSLAEMEADVEALLVNRVHRARQYFRVPIDDCYRLVALLRTHWRGLSGGQAVWQEIERFFSNLTEQASIARR